MSSGIELQSLGAEAEKAWSPFLADLTEGVVRSERLARGLQYPGKKNKVNKNKNIHEKECSSVTDIKYLGASKSLIL